MAAESPPMSKPRTRNRRLAVRIGAVLGLVAVYAGSLLGYHWLANMSHPTAVPNLGTKDDTVVLIDLASLDPVNGRLEMKVSVLPKDSLMDHRFNTLNTDISVQLYPRAEIENLQYRKGEMLAEISTDVTVSGDVNDWPFDTYTTEPIGADVVVGSGDERQVVYARVEVSGSLNGWHARTARSGEATYGSDPDDVSITFDRAKGPLIFGLGICLVIVVLPAMALFVSIETLRGKHKFLPAYAGWYTAMLFALVPLRNLLPGAPPPGAWIDQAIVIWALFALVAAMLLFIVAWNRQDE